ncbi:hypothetical protein ARMGADRAFT_321055 [Armillaria gallica]|uniref:Uncharacterized protein n=1 Tax=Armillaria gallica TaxID=47427 RepID=A0A2H3DEP3_ARMGA|nr:hypothetical protein ARMGADRAFT_321055 [Armillaria gallica]
MLHLSCWARSRADGLECISLGSRPPLRRLARLRVLVLSSSLNCNTARKFLDSCLMMTVSCTFGRLDGDLSVYNMAITPRHKPFSGIPFGAKPQWRASRACGSNISFVIIYWMAKKPPNVLASTRQCPWDNDMASSSQL